jgi:hypothetical protein
MGSSCTLQPALLACFRHPCRRASHCRRLPQCLPVRSLLLKSQRERSSFRGRPRFVQRNKDSCGGKRRMNPYFDQSIDYLQSCTREPQQNLEATSRVISEFKVGSCLKSSYCLRSDTNGSQLRIVRASGGLPGLDTSLPPKLPLFRCPSRLTRNGRFYAEAGSIFLLARAQMLFLFV